MTATDHRPATRSRPVTRHLLHGQLSGIGWLFGMYVGAVVAVGIAIHLIGSVTGSIWSGALQLPRWFALAMGVYCTAIYLPVYVAHGRTRREVGEATAIFAAAFSAVVAVLLTSGFAFEAGLYHLLGWEALLPDPHPLGSVAAAGATLAQQAAALLLYVAVGALFGAAFYRGAGQGLASLPVGVALLAATELLIGVGAGTGVAREIPSLGPIPLPSALAAPSVGLGALLWSLGVGVAAVSTWRLVRDMPVKPRSS